MHYDPLEEESHSELVLLLKRAISAEFDSGDWKEIGYLCGCADTINNHPRLLRSLSWGDEDYDGCVFDMIEHILGLDENNKSKILSFPKIERWVKRNNTEKFQELYSSSSYVSPPLKNHISPRQGVEQALKDAEALIKSSGPVSAVDRVHTALHGYLLSLCQKYALSHSADPSVTELFKLLRQGTPALKSIDSHAGEITKIVKALATILDALNPIRNRGSVAHPNEKLLGEHEAILAINSSRTILHYLEGKL